MVLAFAACTANQAYGQECPRASETGSSIKSLSRTLEGQLIFHDGIRKWFELKLNEAQCDQNSVQLVDIQRKSIPLEIFRGCRIKSSGPIDFSMTGYYSLDTFQDVESVKPIGSCSLRPPFPDYSSTKPDKLIQGYRVDMRVIYRPEDHPIEFHVWSGGRELRPWQAYAGYRLTGGFVLYGACGQGFVVDKVFGPPQANPDHLDDARTPADMAAFDPENAAQSGMTDFHVGYTCVREPLEKPRSP